MKIFKTICLLSFCVVLMTACGGEATQAEATTAQTETKKKHVPHDHDGDGVPDHGPGAHDHSHDKELTAEQKAKIEAEKAEMEAKKAAREVAKNAPPNAAEQATAKALCTCLEKIPTLEKIAGLTDYPAFLKAAEGKAKEVKAMQICHQEVISKAIEKVDGDKGIHAFKARKLANKNCLQSDNDDIWFFMGKFVSDNGGPTPTKK